MKAKLETPRAGLRESYLSLVEEFRRLGEPPVPFTLAFATHDFPSFLATLRACAEGVGLPKGFVAHETFWLVGDDEQVLGVSNLRHCLNESLKKDGGHIGFGIRPSARRRGYATLILGETLKKAKALGITNALVTCDKGNVGSKKAILRNGGVFESEELLPGQADLKQRYWIALTRNAK